MGFLDLRKIVIFPFMLSCVFQHFIINMYWFLYWKVIKLPLGISRGISPTTHPRYQNLQVLKPHGPPYPWILHPLILHRRDSTTRQSSDVEPADRRADCTFTEKTSYCKWTQQFRTLLFKGQLYFNWHLKTCADSMVYFRKFWYQCDFHT